jgi:Transposase DDE domain group 1
MKKLGKKTSAEQKLPFEYDFEQQENLTALAGVPLLVQAFRSLGGPGSVKRNVGIKQRQRGFPEAIYIESFVILNAVGGECLEDFEVLRQDGALAQLVGHEFPSPEAARKFLYEFHEQDKIEQAQKALPLGRVSYIPEESEALLGLGRVNEELIRELGRRCADQKIATIDLDATVIESWKKQAQPTYQKTTGYQPMLALWAEMNVVVADQFRDGNVPALQAPLPVAQRAFAALPETVREYYFRGDSACYESELLEWLRDEQREGGPQGPLQFAVSMRMNATLKQHIGRLGESSWKPYRQDTVCESECADLLNYWPEAEQEKPYGPLRHVVIRRRKRQGELFASGEAVKYFAVVTNVWDWEAKRLLEWHREKAGSIEATHDVLKNELAAGVLPCSRFGANAAWLRMSVITYNVLSALKRLALPAELLAARPKRLRFLVFHTAGRVLYHARQCICRLSRLAISRSDWLLALKQLPLPSTG